MARGVNNANVFIPLMTPEYEASDNCKRECQKAATDKIPMLPLKLSNFKPAGWLSTAIPSGLLYYEFLEKELTSPTSKGKVEEVVRQIQALLPNAVVRKQPKVFICSTANESHLALLLQSQIDVLGKNGNNDIGYECILLHSSGGNLKHDSDYEASSSDEQETEAAKLKREKRLLKHEKNAEPLENVLSGVIAVILVITPEFEDDEECKNAVSLAYSFRKKIIPTVWKPLPEGFPPANLEFCLKSLSFVDFSKIQISAENVKFKIKVENLIKRIEVIDYSDQLFASRGDRNFAIKAVGDWTEIDVSNWLEWIGLIQYAKKFRDECINGRLLLSLSRKDYEALSMSNLHQKVLMSNIGDLMSSLQWSYEEVAEWCAKLNLVETKSKLQDAGIDSKHLFMLEAGDLEHLGVKSTIVQERVMQEIFQLKLTYAKVPVHHEFYRFSVIRNYLLPTPTDQIDKFYFHPDMVSLMKLIFDNVEKQGEGISQTGLRQFILILLIVNYMYKTSYPNKIIWFDANRVEIAVLKDKDILQNLTKKKSELGKDAIDLKSMIQKCGDLLANFQKRKSARLISQVSKQFPLFGPLFLYYVTLNTLVTRLFAVWDRSVNGALAWTELLAGLDMLIYGAYPLKFKLAFCLVDFNGDGDLSADEFTKFNKESFLSLIEFLQAAHPEIFTSINEYSALAQIYNTLKQDLGVKPQLLNEYFKVREYTGGAYRFPNGQRRVIENVLQFGKMHCSAVGRNFDLILESPKPVLLTNFVIGGTDTSFGAVLKDAIVWASDKPIDWKSYSSKFDDFTLEKFLQMPEDAPNRPIRFVSTRKQAPVDFFDFDPPIQAQYIHIKLVRPHVGADPARSTNIDMEFIGFWGYPDVEHLPQKKVTLSSRKLYQELGGRVDEEEDNLTKHSHSNQHVEEEFYAGYKKMGPYVAEMLNACSAMTEGQSMPESASRMGLKASLLNDVATHLAYVEADQGGEHVNQARILLSIRPIIHLFSLFYGYPALDVLQAPL